MSLLPLKIDFEFCEMTLQSQSLNDSNEKLEVTKNNKFCYNGHVMKVESTKNNKNTTKGTVMLHQKRKSEFDGLSYGVRLSCAKFINYAAPSNRKQHFVSRAGLNADGGIDCREAYVARPNALRGISCADEEFAKIINAKH